MESKSSAGMYTGLDNCLISSECCHSFSQLLVTMCAQWYSLSYILFFYHSRYLITSLWDATYMDVLFDADDSPYSVHIFVWKSLPGNLYQVNILRTPHSLK